MISWLWLFLAVFVGLMLGASLSMNATQDAYDEGKESAYNDVEYLQARNRELANKVEINRVIGGVK